MVSELIPVLVSPQVTEAINTVVGCHYFPPGPRLPPQSQNVTALWCGIKLYCSVTEAHDDWSMGGARRRGGQESNMRPVQLPNHSGTEPRYHRNK